MSQSGQEVQGHYQFPALAGGGGSPLKQDFTAAAPNQRWVADITFLYTEEGGLSGADHRPVLTDGDGLGHERAHDG